jgi:hypothetical protein
MTGLARRFRQQDCNSERIRVPRASLPKSLLQLIHGTVTVSWFADACQELKGGIEF